MIKILWFQFTGLIRGPTNLVLADIPYNIGFQFTGLIRGPTLGVLQGFYGRTVSIHRPHTRPDSIALIIICRSVRFNSQASYEARPASARGDQSVFWFQFTGLIRGPTHVTGQACQRFVVSIHRPHTRPDVPGGA